MKTTLILLALLGVFAVAASGQVILSNEDCPTVGISGPLSTVKNGDEVIFTATVSGKYDESSIGYRWTVENGMVSSGDGTREIKVTVSGKTKATVSVTGLDEGCSATVSLSVRYGNVKPSPIFFDEFGKVKKKLLQKRISALVETLKKNPSSEAYIVNYGSAGDVRKREEAIVDLTLPNASGSQPVKIVFVNGGAEEKIRTRVWIVPEGADASKLN